MSKTLKAVLLGVAALAVGAGGVVVAVKLTKKGGAPGATAGAEVAPQVGYGVTPGGTGTAAASTAGGGTAAQLQGWLTLAATGIGAAKQAGLFA